MNSFNFELVMVNQYVANKTTVKSGEQKLIEFEWRVYELEHSGFELFSTKSICSSCQ